MLSKEQASVVADQLLADAQRKSAQRTLSRLSLRAGKLPPGMAPERFRALADEAERHVRTSWELLCPVALAIVGLAVLYHYHLTSLMIVFPPYALLLLNQRRRKLVQP